MRALIQRVSRASVQHNGRRIASIGSGLLVFLGVSRQDDIHDARYLVDRTLNLRIFPDSENRFNFSAIEATAELLLVSQFTLYANTRRGRRPDFSDAAPAAEAEHLYEQAVGLFRESGLKVATGAFGEFMQVGLENEGPVTIMLDSADRHRPRRGS